MSNQLICFIEKDCRVIGLRDMEGEEENQCDVEEGAHLHIGILTELDTGKYGRATHL